MWFAFIGIARVFIMSWQTCGTLINSSGLGSAVHGSIIFTKSSIHVRAIDTSSTFVNSGVSPITILGSGGETLMSSDIIIGLASIT